MLESSLDGFCDEGEDGAVLLSAGFDHGEQCFDETASGGALGAEGKFPPDDGVAERTLGGVVGGVDMFVVDERPEVVEMVEQFRAGRPGGGVAAPLPFLQNHVELALQAVRVTLEPCAGQSPVTNTVPLMEQFLREFQQLSPLFGGAGRRRGAPQFADRLEVSLEVCPAPLPQFEEKVHPGPVATHDPLVVEFQPIVQDAGSPRQPQAEDGETGGHKCPQPGFVRLLFCRRFVDVDVVLPGQGVDQFVKTRPQRRRAQVLHVDDVAHAARLVEQHGEKARRAALAQAKVGHHQRGQGDQTRPRLSRGDTGWQFGARRHATTRTRQPLLLIFGDNRLDLGKFPHLVPQRIGVPTAQRATATAARRRRQQDDFITLLRRNQRPGPLGMARLPTRLSRRLRLRNPGGFVVRMLAARRYRRILRSLLPQRSNLILQSDDPCLGGGQLPLVKSNQCRNHRTGLRSQPAQHLFRQRRRFNILRHAPSVANSPQCAKTIFNSGRERLQARRQSGRVLRWLPVAVLVSSHSGSQ